MEPPKVLRAGGAGSSRSSSSSSSSSSSMSGSKKKTRTRVGKESRCLSKLNGPAIMTAGVKSRSAECAEMELISVKCVVLTAGGSSIGRVEGFAPSRNPKARELFLNTGRTNCSVYDQLPPCRDEDDDSDDEEEDFDHSVEEGRCSEKSTCPDDLYPSPPTDATPHHCRESKPEIHDIVWLAFCFLGIMLSFVLYGLLLEYATSGGRKLHEMSFLFVTSVLYTLTAAAGRYVRDETPSTIPPARFAVLALTSMGSTFCSVRSLRYVIYPIQVLAKSCKPVPVMLMGAVMGKKYPFRKYVNVLLIVGGVGMFMACGDKSSKRAGTEENGSSAQIMGVLLLFISLCFDGGTGAYEDKLMSVHSVGPFDLMYNIQLGKTIIAGAGLVIFNQVHVFMQMCQDMGFVLVALGFTGALGQVFIFVTISKFGALTCSIIGLARKVTTLVASIYVYGHVLNTVQTVGLAICIGSMVLDFMGKKKGKGDDNGGGHHGHVVEDGNNNVANNHGSSNHTPTTRDEDVRPLFTNDAEIHTDDVRKLDLSVTKEKSVLC